MSTTLSNWSDEEIMSLGGDLAELKELIDEHIYMRCWIETCKIPRNDEAARDCMLADTTDRQLFLTRKRYKGRRDRVDLRGDGDRG